MGTKAGHCQPTFFPTSENFFFFFPCLLPTVYCLLRLRRRSFFEAYLSLIKAILSLIKAILSLNKAILSLNRAYLSLPEANLSLPKGYLLSPELALLSPGGELLLFFKRGFRR